MLIDNINKYFINIQHLIGIESIVKYIWIILL